jgi:hypothetical protein
MECYAHLRPRPGAPSTWIARLALIGLTAAGPTMFPPDLGRILFQWTAKTGQVFHVHFGFPKNPLDVYTDGSHATCLEAGLHAQCWESSLQDLARDFAYEAGSTFALQIGALDPQNPTQVHLSREYAFHVAPDPALGVIYYWSTTAKGVRHATLDGRGASDYLTPSTGLTAAQAAALTPSDQQARCVACQTLFPDAPVNIDPR